MEKLQTTLLKRIEDEYHHKPFLVTDFLDLGNYETIKKSLQRLEEKGKIARIMRGMYCVPIFSPTLNKYVTSSIRDIAYALARQNHWTICPDKEHCMGMVGLSNQIPASYRFLSTGPYRVYYIKGFRVVFLHTADKYVSPRFSDETMILIQAIRGKSKESISNEDVLEMRQTYSDVDFDKVEDEAKYTSPWIYDVIKKVGDRSYV